MTGSLPGSPLEPTGDGPWMTVVNPDDFMTWCAQCGEKFRKGGKAQRIQGGYGYRCDRHMPVAADRNADSNRDRGHQRTTRDKGARDLVLPHWSPLLSAVAYDYGSEGWGFESLRARYPDQRKRCGLQGCNSQKVVA